VATVNDRPIYRAEVKRHYEKVFGDRQVEPEARELLLVQTLQQLIDRRLVLTYLAFRRQGASKQDIDLALAQVSKKLARQNQTLEQFLSKSGVDLSTFRTQLAWQIGWPKCVDHFVTDVNIERFFKQHQKDFDGTKIRVSQIFFQVPKPEQLDQVLAQAEKIRQDIVAGKTSFAAAASKFSQSPSGKNGGDQGFIDRHDTMPEAFSKAAFTVNKGEVSEPVVTALGVHLIKVVGETPGKKTWKDVRAPLTQAATQFLFQRLANGQRKKATIVYRDKTLEPKAPVR
jgi:parvulin-like peptidyl-prolyl isomerase